MASAQGRRYVRVEASPANGSSTPASARHGHAGLNLPKRQSAAASACCNFALLGGGSAHKVIEAVHGCMEKSLEGVIVAPSLVEGRQKLDDECEDMVEKFLDEEITEREFMSEFLKKRTRYHKMMAKLEIWKNQNK